MGHIHTEIERADIVRKFCKSWNAGERSLNAGDVLACAGAVLAGGGFCVCMGDFDGVLLRLAFLPEADPRNSPCWAIQAMEGGKWEEIEVFYLLEDAAESFCRGLY